MDRRTGKKKPKGWYVVIDWHGQRKAKSFGTNKKLAKEFADKLTLKLKWAEENGEILCLSRFDLDGSGT